MSICIECPYEHIWEAAYGEILDCHNEPENANDCYTMAVAKSVMIVGHFSKKLSFTLSLFARRGGIIG